MTWIIRQGNLFEANIFVGPESEMREFVLRLHNERGPDKIDVWGPLEKKRTFTFKTVMDEVLEEG